MAEANGSGKIDDHDARIGRLEAARKEMEDALIVMAHLETKSSQRIKEHAQFIENHEKWMENHELAMREFDGKLNALIEIVGRMQGGIESHS